MSNPARRRRHGAVARLRLLALLPVLLAPAGCSLISLKSPERPLSPRDLKRSHPDT